MESIVQVIGMGKFLFYVCEEYTNFFSCTSDSLLAVSPRNTSHHFQDFSVELI